MPEKWHNFLNVRDNITNILTVNEDRIGNQVGSKEVHKQQEGYHYKSYGDINADNIYVSEKVQSNYPNQFYPNSPIYISVTTLKINKA